MDNRVVASPAFQVKAEVEYSYVTEKHNTIELV